MGGGFESRCVRRVYGADGTVQSRCVRRVYGADGAVCTAPSAPYTRRTQRLSRPPPIHKFGAETICCNLTSIAPDDERMRPKHVELRMHQ